VIALTPFTDIPKALLYDSKSSAKITAGSEVIPTYQDGGKRFCVPFRKRFGLEKGDRPNSNIKIITKKVFLLYRKFPILICKSSRGVIVKIIQLG